MADSFLYFLKGYFEKEENPEEEKSSTLQKSALGYRTKENKINFIL